MRRKDQVFVFRLRGGFVVVVVAVARSGWGRMVSLRNVEEEAASLLLSSWLLKALRICSWCS